jgi:hypothetical protein
MKKNTNKPKIWNETYKTNGVDGDIYMRLLEGKEKDISVIVCDKDGKEIEDGVLLTFDFDYRAVLLAPDVSENVPLKTDVAGYLLTENIENIVKRTRDLAMTSMSKVFLRHAMENEQKTNTIN